MPGYQETIKELEQSQVFRNASKEEKNGMLLMVQRHFTNAAQTRAQELQAKYKDTAKVAQGGGDVDAARQDAIRSTVAVRQQAQNEIQNPLLRGLAKAGSAGVAGLASYANTATFGNAPALASLLPAATGVMDRGTAEEAARARIGAAQEMHPVASAVGSVAGVFGPGPFKLLTGAAGQLAAPLARMSGKAAEAAFESGLAQYAAKVIPQIGANIAGSGLAIGTMNMLNDLTGGKGVADRIKQTLTDTVSPTNLAMSGGIGAAQAAFRTTPIPARVSLLKQMEREIPGFKATPDMYRDGDAVVGALSQMGNSNIPFVSTAANKIARQSVIEPLQESVKGLRGAMGAVDDAVSAERPLRTALGTPQIPGAAKQGVMGKQAVARGAANPQIVPRQTLIDFTKAAVTFGKKEGGGSGGRGSELSGVISDVRGELAKQMRAVHANKNPRQPYNVKALLNIKERLDDIADWEGAAKSGMIATKMFSQRDVREAKALRDVIHTFIETQVPAVERANRAQAAVSRVADAFSTPEALTALKHAPDGTLLNQVFKPETFFSRVVNGKKTLGRWQAFKNVVGQEGQQAARGNYVEMYLKAMNSGAGERALPGAWTPLLSKFNEHDKNVSSMFNRHIADEIAPGLRPWVENRARIMELFRKGIGNSTGSNTGNKALVAAGVLGGGAVTVGAYELLADNKDNRVRTLLGALGTVGTLALARSMMGGNVAAQLNKLATGAPVLGPTTTAAALAGNESPLKRAANTGIGAIPTAADAIATSAARLGQSR